MKAGRYVSIVAGLLVAAAMPLSAFGKPDDKDGPKKDKPEARLEQRDDKEDRKKEKPEGKVEQRDEKSMDARLDKIAEQLERLQGDVKKLKEREGDRPAMRPDRDGMFKSLQERLEKAQKESREQSPREAAEQLREVLREEMRRLDRFIGEDGPRPRGEFGDRGPGPRDGRGR